MVCSPLGVGRRLIPWFAAVTLFASAGAALALPKALVRPEVQDAGPVEAGAPVRVSYRIANAGDEVLTLTLLRAGRGCTVVRLDEAIAVDAVGVLEVELDTTGLRGPVKKSIVLSSSDPHRRELTLTLKARVQPPVAASPGFARFQHVQGEPSQAFDLVLTARDGRAIRILGLKSSAPHVLVRELVADGPPTVRIELARDAPVGALRARVELLLDHPRQESLLVPVSGFVRPRQIVTPSRVDLGRLDREDLPRRLEIRFTHQLDAGIRVSRVDVDVPGVAAEVEQLDKSGHEFRVRLTLGAGMAAGAFEGVVRVHHDDAPSNPLRIPLAGLLVD